MSEKKRQSSGHHDRGSSKRSKKGGGFVMDMQYKNELPPIPMMPKWIKIPWNPERVYKYRVSSLEQKYQYRVHMEPTVGIPVHLIDPTTAEDSHMSLDDADRHLLRRDNDESLDSYGGAGRREPKTLSSFGTCLSVRRIFEANNVRKGKHWLRRTVYMDNNQFAGQSRVVSGAEESDKMQKTLEKQRKHMDINNNLSFSERIAKSFQVAKELPVHRKKNLAPVRIFNIVPSFKLAEQPLYQSQFMDKNIFEGVRVGNGPAKTPSNRAKLTEDEVKLLSHCILHPCNEKGADDAVKFLVPDTPSDNLGEKFHWARDYRMSMEKGNDKERFVLVYDNEDLAKPASKENPVTANVEFGELQMDILTLNRTVVGLYDMEKSRAQTVTVDRRPFSITESDQRKKDRQTLEDGYYLTDMNLDEEVAEPEAIDDDKSTVRSESSDEEAELGHQIQKDKMKSAGFESSSSSDSSLSDGDDSD